MPEAAASGLVLGVVLATLAVGSRAQAVAVTRGWLPAWVGRKVAHVGLGSAILVSWAFYPEAPSSRWLAALPPMLVAAYFGAIGFGWLRDDGTVAGGSRSGTPRGLLRGPLYFSTMLVLLTVVFWRTSPLGVAALGFLTLGDAAGEIVGKAVRSPRLPWRGQKTLAGSLGVLAFGWGGGMAGLALLAWGGWIPGPPEAYLMPMVWVALTGAFVESLPFAEVDNVLVPLACVVVGGFVLHP